MHKFYIVVEGPDFDAVAFDRAHGLPGKDRVRNRKQMMNGVAVNSRQYWSSEPIEFALEDNCDRHIELISRLRAGFGQLSPDVHIRVVLILGTERQRVQGFYFPREFMMALSGLRWELDIDIQEKNIAGE